MPVDELPPPSFEKRILEQLACPACYGALHLAQSGIGIACANCRRVYPLVDGIPVLIA